MPDSVTNPNPLSNSTSVSSVTDFFDAPTRAGGVAPSPFSSTTQNFLPPSPSEILPNPGENPLIASTLGEWPLRPLEWANAQAAAKDNFEVKNIADACSSFFASEPGARAPLLTGSALTQFREKFSGYLADQGVDKEDLLQGLDRLKMLLEPALSVLDGDLMNADLDPEPDLATPPLPRMNPAFDTNRDRVYVPAPLEEQEGPPINLPKKWWFRLITKVAPLFLPFGFIVPLVKPVIRIIRALMEEEEQHR